jgi:hypothetical protein
VHRREKDLTGGAAQLKGKELRGFLAGRTVISDPVQLKLLQSRCEEHGYRIMVTSGRALSPGNSRVPQLRVECAIRRRMCSRTACALRVSL